MSFTTNMIRVDEHSRVALYPEAIDVEIDAVRFQLHAIVSSRCVPLDRFN